MASTGKVLNKIIPILKDMPPGIFFETGNAPEEGFVKFQASTLEQVKQIRTFFPGTIWKKHWSKTLKWWEYRTEWEGLHLEIYAVRETPATCTAIYETREVEERIPLNEVKYGKVLKTKKVFVGWDCGPDKDEQLPTEE